MLDKLDFTLKASACTRDRNSLKTTNNLSTDAGASGVRGFGDRHELTRINVNKDLHISYRDYEPFEYRIEITKAGRDNLWETLCLLSKMFGTNIKNASVKRMDLAVDLAHYPISWFRKHMRVKHKQNDKKFFDGPTSDSF